MRAKSRSFTRRTMLRGLGVSVALPWFESMSAFAGERESHDAPLRLGILFAGNGFHSREWWAKGEGKAMELGRVLAPLEPYREKMLFIRGLYNAEALKGNIHSSMTGNLLSGAPLAAGGEIRSGHEFRSDHRAELWRRDQSAEPRARMREGEPVGAQELLDALQLAHLLELTDQPDPPRSLSGARL